MGSVIMEGFQTSRTIVYYKKTGNFDSDIIMSHVSVILKIRPTN